MLAATVAAGAMPLLALLMLDVSSKGAIDARVLHQRARSARRSRSGLPTWAPASSTALAETWPRPASWGATGWKRSWAKAAWARCGVPSIACSRVPPPSSSFGPSLAGDRRPECRTTRVRRFEREAQVIARLRSPHTVKLFDFGIAADGAFYYVDGAARRTRRRCARAALRARPGRTGHPPAAPDVPFAVRSRVLRPRPSRHQAREHLRVPVRRGVRLREGARFRHRARRCTRSRRRRRPHA